MNPVAEEVTVEPGPAAAEPVSGVAALVDAEDGGAGADGDRLSADDVAGRFGAADSEPSQTANVTADAVGGLLGGAHRATAPLTIGAEGGLTLVLGDVVGRDKTSHGGPEVASQTAPRWLRVPAEDLALAQAAFVKPDGFDLLAPQLRRRRVMILRVAPGRGGRTATLRLLDDLGARPILQLPTDTDLRRVDASQIMAGGGCLLRDAGPGWASRLTELDLQRLNQDFARRNAWLVLVVDAKARFADQILAEYVSDLGEAPPAEEVLSMHLRHLLGPGSREVGDAVINDADVAGLLRTLLDRPDRISRAAELAVLLAEETREVELGVALIAVRQRMARLADGNFEAWFDGLTELGDRCLALALGVLHGATREGAFSFELVSEAAQSLEHRLRVEDESDRDKPSPPVDPFAVRRGERLERIRAQLIKVNQNTPYGRLPVDVARFDDTDWPRRILTRVWREHPGVRTQLLDWLRELARHPVLRVRVHAATAVGLLSCLSFDYIRRTVIEPWSLSAHGPEREAAASALKIPADHDDFATPVRRMVAQWSRDDAAETRRCTAARAHGISLGVRDAGYALRSLGRLAGGQQGHISLTMLQAIRNSLSDLIVNGDESVAEEVLVAVRDWAIDGREPPLSEAAESRQRLPKENKERQRIRQATGFYAFLGIASTLRMRAAVDDRPDAVAWPGLLWVAEGDATHHTAIAELWGRAVVDNLAHEMAGNVLWSWARTVDPDDRGRAALATLLVAAANRERTYLVIHRHAQNWTTDRQDQRAARTGAVVIEALEKMKDGR